MSEETYKYEADDIVVEYEAKRCIHAAKCVNGLPEVFDPKRRPWVDPKRAPVEQIAKVVATCPTGALRVKGVQELPPETNEVLVEEDGPVYVKGEIRLSTSQGTSEETRIALCRCGASKNKPFCDNSHEEAGFKDDGNLGELSLGQGETETDVLEIGLAPNGPLLLKGPCVVRGTGEDEAQEGVKGALCRCGESKNKPYCDGSHKEAGFQAD
jgi:CDGSH-type Zn-finger protein/uncharacterized Fe-S cluster protein YjdI